jgi:hypothetical protein
MPRGIPMRFQLTILSALCLASGGCAIDTERSSLELGHEAVRLMREASDRNEYFLQNKEERRELAKQQLQLVKQASAQKGGATGPTTGPKA